MDSGVFKTIIDSLQYVTNIYSLVGFLCLICIYFIANHHIKPSNLVTSLIMILRIRTSVRLKKITVSFIFVITITMIGLFLNDIRVKVTSQKDAIIAEVTARIYKETTSQKETLIEKDKWKKLHKRVEVKLLDITKLKSEKKPIKWCNNKERVHIYRTVFEKAGLKEPEHTAWQVISMNEEEWNGFLDGLSLDTNPRSKIELTPFARLIVYIDDVEEVSFENQGFFKGEDIKIGARGNEPPIVCYQLTHVYDVYDTEEEPEAVIVKLIK